MSKYSKYFKKNGPYLLLRRLKLDKILSDRKSIEKEYTRKVGHRPDLDNPVTFTEKMQWLKLNYHNPVLVPMTDKYEAKKIIDEKLGEGYTVPTIGVWDRFSSIDFDSLPDSFVLKCNHDSGGLVICKDKSALDIDAARKKINSCLKTNYFWFGREWAYRGIKPKIIAEPYLEDSKTGELRDYKFLCFDGKAKLMFVTTDRQKSKPTTQNFFDMDYNNLEIYNHYQHAETIPEKPETFDRMIEISEILSAGLPYLRVDFYEVDGRLYVGELTFYHASGFKAFEPEEWDYKLGEWLTLPEPMK